MNKWNCLIVDDEPVAQRIIEGYLNEFEDFCLKAKCYNAIEANDILLREKIDLIFLDLEMPKIKGFQFLSTLADPPQIIITTAYREYAIEGYEFDILDYLLKPISFERFLKSINKFRKQISYTLTADLNTTSERQKFIYVKSDRKTIKIRKADIELIEGMNNYIKISHKGNTSIVYTSLTKILQELDDHFIRIHKSFIINRQYVQSFNSELVELENTKVPVGSSYKEQVKLL